MSQRSERKRKLAGTTTGPKPVAECRKRKQWVAAATPGTKPVVGQQQHKKSKNEENGTETTTANGRRRRRARKTSRKSSINSGINMRRRSNKKAPGRSGSSRPKIKQLRTKMRMIGEKQKKHKDG